MAGKKPDKLPHMPLWVYDLEADEDCSLMDLAEYGAFLRLLQRQWIEGSVPNDPSLLARLLRVTDDEFARIWRTISRKFFADKSGRLRNQRLDQERVKATRKVRVNKKNGALGGRPKSQTERLSGREASGSIRASGSGSGSDSSGSEGKGERGKGRPPDPIWDAIAELFHPSGVPDSRRTFLGSIVRDLKKLGATPDAIRLRHKHATDADWTPFTPRAIVDHWDTLAQPVLRRREAGGDSGRLAGTSAQARRAAAREREYPEPDRKAPTL